MPYVCFQCTFVNVMRLLPATSVALIEQWVQCVCWNNNFELMDLWSRYLTWWFSLTSSRSCSKVTGWKIFFCSYGCSQFIEKWKWSWGKPLWYSTGKMCMVMMLCWFHCGMAEVSAVVSAAALVCCLFSSLLHFARVIDDVKCIVVTAVCAVPYVTGSQPFASWILFAPR